MDFLVDLKKKFIVAFYSKRSDKVWTTDIFKKYFEGGSYVFFLKNQTFETRILLPQLGHSFLSRIIFFFKYGSFLKPNLRSSSINSHFQKFLWGVDSWSCSTIQWEVWCMWAEGSYFSFLFFYIRNSRWLPLQDMFVIGPKVKIIS